MSSQQSKVSLGPFLWHGCSRALSEQPCSKEHLVPCSGAPVAPNCPQPWTLSHSLLPSQNNLISKVPRGALSRQTHLRELYLQHNQLTDSGLDATTFRWGLEQGFGGCRLVLAVGSEDLESGSPSPPFHHPPLTANSRPHLVCAYRVPGLAKHLASNQLVPWSYYPTSQLPHEDLRPRTLT